ncbi:unnamed protein product [Eruca vesicaria subsp. sativa]|uniref:Secreted protein n=1 Tax=Eruca vesicaria subsp. sativa TaxID=29727 RepID=A0ABC8ISB2_ERUVS|nr:unnamed protein product [Eruca vesicaria subsp. sativa]
MHHPLSLAPSARETLLVVLLQQCLLPAPPSLSHESQDLFLWRNGLVYTPGLFMLIFIKRAGKRHATLKIIVFHLLF